MNDIDRFIEAADAMARATKTYFAVIEKPDHTATSAAVAKHFVEVRVYEYRAAREAITRGTPPAFATSA